MPVSLVALKKLTYAWQTYVAGEIFEARDDADAMVLKMTNLAADGPVKPEPSSEPSEGSPSDTPQDPTEETPSPVRRRRAYRRSDMTAEQ